MLTLVARALTLRMTHVAARWHDIPPQTLSTNTSIFQPHSSMTLDLLHVLTLGGAPEQQNSTSIASHTSETSSKLVRLFYIG